MMRKMCAKRWFLIAILVATGQFMLWMINNWQAYDHLSGLEQFVYCFATIIPIILCGTMIGLIHIYNTEIERKIQRDTEAFVRAELSRDPTAEAKYQKFLDKLYSLDSDDKQKG